MSKREVHVVPVKTGGWEVRSAKSGVLSTHVRKRDAVVSARSKLRTGGGGEAIVYTTSGRISEKDTVAPSSDDS